MADFLPRGFPVAGEHHVGGRSAPAGELARPTRPECAVAALDGLLAAAHPLEVVHHLVGHVVMVARYASAGRVETGAIAR